MGKKRKIPADNLPTDQSSATSHQEYHTPVLLNEVIVGLNIRPNGVYVDCTFGGGGHAKAILEKLSKKGKLFVFDQDADAKKNVPDDERMVFVPQNFRYLQRFLRLHNVRFVDGIMADLGVSSHQFDEADRGFSIRFDAALDMRMDQRQEKKASDIIRNYTEQELHKLFEQYGEVTNAKTLAKKIVELRKSVQLDKVDNFKSALREIVKGNPNRYFAQVFQALRIEVNDELGALKELLLQAPLLLSPGGRIAIITFHSLEDRLVKYFFRHGFFEQKEENPFTMTEDVNELSIVTKKPISASEKELKNNPRSRSAKLRIAEKKMIE